MGVHDMSKYQEVKRLFEVPQDEPLFILRAQDRIAIPTIQVYRAMYEIGANEVASVAGRPSNVAAFADHLTAVVDNFRRWTIKNYSKMKLPD